MHTLAFLQNLSSWEIVLIFLVVLLFFGAKRLPELFRSLGKSVKEFKSATSGIEEDIRSAMEAEEPVKKPTPAAKVESKSVEATPSPVEPAATEAPEKSSEKDKA
ncbi:MAG TPA: twin-arginine translocase TatA/TatE family subunit [Opitutae bacterium]|nr:twin-arginine translocase TatA/TatE family subunit [Opitutae bacterium]